MGALGYRANVAWGSRADNPQDLAARVVDMMPKISGIHPIFSKWYTVTDNNTFRPLDLRAVPIADEIAARVVRSEDAEPEPAEGYHWTAYSFGEPKWTPQGFSIRLRGGSYGSWSSNSACFSTADMIDADLSLVTFSIFKDALLTLVDTFDASFGGAFSTKLSDLWVRGRDATRLDLEWMTYVGPRFAPLVAPPSTAIVERRANGGLFMAATDARFSADNPAHMAASRDILAAVAPLNALPKPCPGLEG